MAKNPNELAKIMEEMMKSLQQLSEEQLDSVGGIVSSQKKAIVKQKKEKKAKEILEKLAKDTEATKVRGSKKIIDETLKQKEDLVANFDKNLLELSTSFTRTKKQVTSIASKMGSDLVNSLGLRGVFDTYAASKKLLSDPKQFLKDKIFGPQKPISNALTIKRDLILSDTKIGKISLSNKGNIYLNAKKVSSEDSFDAHKIDYDLEEYKLLKTIDDKMSKNKITGESGGLFDLLANGLKDITEVVKAGLGDAALGGLGVAGGGLGAILAKAKRIPGAKTLGKVGTLIAEHPGKSSLIAGGVGLATYGASQILGNEDSENREVGGKIEKNKPYIVGEDGPELVIPNNNGTILPNDKISTSLTKDQFAKLRMSQKNRSNAFVDDIKSGLESYFKPATISMNKYFKTYTDDYATYKTEVKDSMLTIFDTLKKWWQDIKDVGTAAVDKTKGFVGKIVDGGKSLIDTGKKKILNMVGLGTEDNNSTNPNPDVILPPTPSAIPQPQIAPTAVIPPMGTDYNLPAPQQAQTPTQVPSFGEGFIDAFSTFFKNPKEETREASSSIISNPYGVSRK